MAEPTCVQLNKWMQAGPPVAYIQMDNARENKLFQKQTESTDWKLKIDYKYTARNTLQQNHLGELGFAALSKKRRAMMSAANIPMSIQYYLFCKAFKTATLLDGLMVKNIEGKDATRYVHFCGHNPKFALHLNTWGEAGTVTLKGKQTAKISDRGAACMFVGYATDHTGDCYRMWDPKTKRVHETRDVIWLKRMNYQQPGNKLNMLIH